MGKTFQKADPNLQKIFDKVLREHHSRLLSVDEAWRQTAAGEPDRDDDDDDPGYDDEPAPQENWPEVRVELMLVYASRNSDGTISATTPIKVRGREAIACVRITSLEERVAGRGDAIIWVDGDRRQRMDVQTLEAVLDHELTHLERGTTGQGSYTDDAGRPILRMRQHDFEVGWFHEVAERHGERSVEVQQARTLISQQMYFPGFDIAPREAKKAGSPKKLSRKRAAAAAGA